MNVQWWCSARGTPWDGSWQAYPGVWLFVIAVGFLFWRLRPNEQTIKRAIEQSSNRTIEQSSNRAIEPSSSRAIEQSSNRAIEQSSNRTIEQSSNRASNHTLYLTAALLTLWLSLDWPVGPLGAGYLAWVHSVQFLMLAMVVPPLLLLSVDRDRIAVFFERNAVFAGILRRLTQPLFAIILFAVTMVVTHLPGVVDTLMASQAGAFALDLAWLVVGLFFWWPVVIRVPTRPHFPPLVQMLYVFFGTQPHLYIAMWLLAADYPSYGTYELAPRITPLSAITDQQIAGAVMLGFGATYVLGVITVLFFRWMQRETV